MPTNTRTAAVVYNPIKVDLDVAPGAVDREAPSAGWGETLWFETSVEDVGQGATQARPSTRAPT